MSGERPVIIGLNCDQFDRNGPISGVRDPYWEMIEAAGGVPLLMPPLRDAEMIDALLDRVDAFVMIGGDDLGAERLGLAAVPETVTPIDPRRDRADFVLLERLLARQMPTLGICLACQELNVLRGGSLYLDLPSELHAQQPVAHQDRQKGYAATHPLQVAPDSLLGRIWGGAATMEVNSGHHQGLREIGAGLRPVAWAPDGLVEAVEVEAQPFFVAVQWHPEKMQDRPEQVRLFEALVAQARRG